MSEIISSGSANKSAHSSHNVEAKPDNKPMESDETKSKKAKSLLKVEARTPVNAMKDYGADDIPRQEKAEEAIRQHFRDISNRLSDNNKIDRKA
ncbi:MAG: hypothetical protein P9L92_19035 [Candidatus Electryonea clarkiae]|nr:hypothetical protein [Candidatus Electryonea clarkiae]MDP8287161.1 hypothetical protein [Candidatus Electryonea clarkiae]